MRHSVLRIRIRPGSISQRYGSNCEISILLHPCSHLLVLFCLAAALVAGLVVLLERVDAPLGVVGNILPHLLQPVLPVALHLNHHAAELLHTHSSGIKRSSSFPYIWQESFTHRKKSGCGFIEKLGPHECFGSCLIEWGTRSGILS
jgi:hypothetical protein